MYKLRIHIARLAVFIAALQIMNMSLFVQEFMPLKSSINGDDINIINTIDEYVTEVVLGHIDAVPEYNDHSKKDIQIQKHMVFKMVAAEQVLPVIVFATERAIYHPSLPNNYKNEYFQEINPPPPRLA